jgi:molecular chaperone IbpA
MAIAGFGPSEIELVQEGNVLSVTGQKNAGQENREMLHHGLAYRNFKQTFNLADHVKVSAANLENGLLAIELTREIPEQLKPRRIDVQSVAPLPAREKAPELTAKAA